MATKTKAILKGRTNKFKVGGHKVVVGQTNRFEPWSIYISTGGWMCPNGKDINKTMTTVDRLFRIWIEDAFKMYFAEDKPLVVFKDILWSDSDHLDYSNIYSFVNIEITALWHKNKVIDYKDERFELFGWAINEWFKNNSLVSFVAVNPKKSQG